MAIGIVVAATAATGQDEDPFDDRRPSRQDLGPAAAELADELAAALARSRQQRAERDWTVTGRPVVRGAFSEFQDDKVCIRASSGDVVAVPFGELASPDQAAVFGIISTDQQVCALQGRYQIALQERFLAMEREAGALSGKVAAAERRAAEAERRLAAVAPGNALAERDGVTDITLKRFTLFGRDFLGKTVRIRGCKYSDINDSVDNMPGVTLATDGLMSRIDVAQKNRWIHVLFGDPTEFLFHNGYASKKEFAETFLSLSRGDVFDCEATVVELERNGGKPGLLITKVSIVSKSRQADGAPASGN